MLFDIAVPLTLVCQTRLGLLSFLMSLYPNLPTCDTIRAVART